MFKKIAWFVGLFVCTVLITNSLAKPPRKNIKSMSYSGICTLSLGTISVDNQRFNGLASINGYANTHCTGRNATTNCGTVTCQLHVVNLSPPFDEYVETGSIGPMACGDNDYTEVSASPLLVGDTYYYEWSGSNSSGQLWYLNGFMVPN